MKNFIIFLIFISVIPLIAKDFYVQVAQLKSHKNALFLQKELVEDGYPSKIIKKAALFKVYTGPYPTQNQAKKISIKISNKFSKPKKQKATILILKTSRSIPIKKNHPPTKKKRALQPQKDIPKNNLFFSLSLGSNYLQVKDSNPSSSILITSIPDEDGLEYEIECGYYLSSHLYSSLSYQYSNFDNVNFNNALMSLNYRFDKIGDVHPYIGFLAGYSMMQWSENPIGTGASRVQSYSFVRGAQVGTEVYMSKNLSLHMFYRYLKMNHITTITVGLDTKTYTHKSLQNLSFGLRYYF